MRVKSNTFGYLPMLEPCKFIIFLFTCGILIGFANKCFNIDNWSDIFAIWSSNFKLIPITELLTNSSYASSMQFEERVGHITNDLFLYPALDHFVKYIFIEWDHLHFSLQPVYKLPFHYNNLWIFSIQLHSHLDIIINLCNAIDFLIVSGSYSESLWLVFELLFVSLFCRFFLLSLQRLLLLLCIALTHLEYICISNIFFFIVCCRTLFRSQPSGTELALCFSLLVVGFVAVCCHSSSPTTV